MDLIRVEVVEQKISGVNKSQRPYSIYAAFAHVPGSKYPLPIEFYSETVYPLGVELDVPMVPSAKDGKLAYLPDFKAAKQTRKLAQAGA